MARLQVAVRAARAPELDVQDLRCASRSVGDSFGDANDEDGSVVDRLAVAERFHGVHHRD
jgi:hypothetical protein